MRSGKGGGRVALRIQIPEERTHWDANVNWAAAADGTLEERIYYCHNWRGDVSVLIEDDADMVEWVKYSSYGIPFGLPKGDQDSDGDLVQNVPPSATQGFASSRPVAGEGVIGRAMRFWHSRLTAC